MAWEKVIHGQARNNFPYIRVKRDGGVFLPQFMRNQLGDKVTIEVDRQQGLVALSAGTGKGDVQFKGMTSPVVLWQVEDIVKQCVPIHDLPSKTASLLVEGERIGDRFVFDIAKYQKG